MEEWTLERAAGSCILEEEGRLRTQMQERVGCGVGHREVASVFSVKQEAQSLAEREKQEEVES